MRKLFLFLPMIAVLGCTDASISHLTAYGSGNIVTVWSGGVAVKTYKATGQVKSEKESDGFFFKDEKTGRLVRVSGTITIEQQ